MNGTSANARMPRRTRLGLGLLVVILAGGCGSGIHPVEGTVVWEDGTPAKELEGSHVVFDLPELHLGARGVVQADGSFRLTTNTPDDGAMVGEHTVYVLERRKLVTLGGTTLAPGIMEARFASAATSGLKATVAAGKNHITLTVVCAARR
jgi:hypothetical protein